MKIIFGVIIFSFALIALEVGISVGDCRTGINSACEILEIYNINTDHLKTSGESSNNQSSGETNNV